MNVTTSIDQAYGPGNSFYPRVTAAKTGRPDGGPPVSGSGTGGKTGTNPSSSAKGNTGEENRSGSEIKSRAASDAGLTDAEKKIVEELKQADAEIKRHEMAHVAAGAGITTSGANYTYKTGPDGQRYAVAGDVKINMSAVPGDPQATIDKMAKVKRAALAPASPSAQDRRVASKASALAAQAMQELMVKTAQEQASANEEKAFGNVRKAAADGYARVQNTPLEPRSTFSTAV